jgi:hypothetical protein
MNLLQHQYTIYARSDSGDKDTEKMINTVYLKNRNHFSKLYVGDRSIILENSSLINLFAKHQKFGEISIGEIYFEPKLNHIVVRSKISYLRWLIIHCAIVVMFLGPLILIETDFYLFWVLSGTLLIGFRFMCPTFFAPSFRIMILDCISECGLKVK